MLSVQNPICILRLEFRRRILGAQASYPPLVVSVLVVVALDCSAGQ